MADPKSHHYSYNISSTKTLPNNNSSSSSLTSNMKLKTLLQTFIFSHMYRFARALTKAKSVLLQLLKEVQFINLHQLRRSNKQNKKLFFSSFRLHYNWCSSHVMPVGLETYSNSHVTNSYYDASWNSVINTTAFGCAHHNESDNELSRYLQWLEEKGNLEEGSNEIDKLADLFIANCHEKFRLEKQESYRRYQEMMARSV